MPTSERYPPPSGRTARERIAARRRARRAGSWRTFALAAALVVALALIGTAALALRRAGQTIDSIQQEDPRYRTAAATPEAVVAAATPGATASPAALPAGDPSPAPLQRLDRPFSVLLIGVDRRPNPEEGVRSDTLILVRIDPVNRTASMLSIPRDSIVLVPDLGWSKINAAYGHGYTSAEALYGPGTDPSAAGAAVVAATVEQFLDVTVDYSAQIDFRGFERLVDTVGGVPVDVPVPILDAEYPTENYGVERIYIAPGLQVLDGRTALVYARTRHASSDFDRSQRQQQVLRALLDRVRARGLLENAQLLPRWAEVLEENVRTTLPIGDLTLMADLAALARDLRGERILTLSINPDDVAVDREDGSDIYWNPGDLAALVTRWEAGPAPEAAGGTAALPTLGPAATAGTPVVAPLEPGTVVQVLNGAAVEGIAGQVTEQLRSQGFELADPETLSRVYEHSLIIDYRGRPETRRRLAELLGVAPRFVQASPAPDAPPPGYNVDIVVVVGLDYRPEWAGRSATP